MGDLLQNAQQEAEEGNVDAASAMRKIGNVYLQNREVSAQEAVYRVTGLHLKECTRDVVFIPAGSNIVKMSLPISIIKSRCSQGGGDNQNIWMTSIHKKYYARPDHSTFNDMCLAEFCSQFRILSKSQNQKSTVKLPVYQLKNDLGSIRKRKQEKQPSYDIQGLIQRKTRRNTILLWHNCTYLTGVQSFCLPILKTLRATSKMDLLMDNKFLMLSIETNVTLR